MFKKYGFSIIAVVFALVLVSFENAPGFHQPLADNWYIYNGSPMNPQNQAAYYSLEGTAHTPCESSTKLCAIRITDDDGTLTNAEVQALIDAENGNTSSSTFPAESANVDFKE